MEKVSPYFIFCPFYYSNAPKMSSSSLRIFWGFEQYSLSKEYSEQTTCRYCTNSILFTPSPLGKGNTANLRWQKKSGLKKIRGITGFEPLPHNVRQ
ncbi:hypothetical protein SAMN02745171_01336 [Porphyromonas circumdentaria]|uniref:Uncharacterized protein n=1 Tax=Porphyromonas circumdentaria TaxID=29524 RepID=A0A1T4P5A9_9PORP|nr:hypothetical protein [Porphyromonas circumdentaria]SJZ86703.1 hypothetical protein SAMN02745171_01336 [Porphyromonas circumdentaria]